MIFPIGFVALLPTLMQGVIFMEYISPVSAFISYGSSPFLHVLCVVSQIRFCNCQLPKKAYDLIQLPVDTVGITWCIRPSLAKITSPTRISFLNEKVSFSGRSRFLVPWDVLFQKPLAHFDKSHFSFSRHFRRSVDFCRRSLFPRLFNIRWIVFLLSTLSASSCLHLLQSERSFYFMKRSPR